MSRICRKSIAILYIPIWRDSYERGNEYDRICSNFTFQYGEIHTYTIFQIAKGTKAFTFQHGEV